MSRRYMFLGLIAIVAAAAALAPPSATAQVKYLEYVGTLKSLIPGNCSTWHEIYPQYCTPHHQDNYVSSSGTSEMSACDYIMLDGVWWHVDWVGPTYYLSYGTGVIAAEPLGSTTGENPTCQMWQEIWPDFGIVRHVDEWVDNGDGVISVCDQVMMGGIVYHIDRIELNITVSPGPIDIEQMSWGALKNGY